MCADIYTWHLNDKWKLIMITMMLPSSFSGSIFIILSINFRPYDFLQQITKYSAPEHLQSKYHKGQSYVPSYPKPDV